MLAGYVPDTDIRLGRMRDGEHQHRPGLDITLSAPKSVSFEGLVFGERRVVRAHDEAVRETLDWIESDLLQTRGYNPTTGRRPRERAHGMVAALFRHLTSRNQDPQLHTHCIVANRRATPRASGEASRPRRCGEARSSSGRTTAATLPGMPRVHGLAPSSAAVRALARGAGIETRTLQWFLARFDDLSDAERLARGREAYAGSVLAIDEASMVGTVQMEALLRIAAKLEVSRVVLIGDTRQLRAVDAGQPFRVLQRAGMATTVMDEVHGRAGYGFSTGDEKVRIEGAHSGESDHRFRAERDQRIRSKWSPVGAKRRGCWIMSRGDQFGSMVGVFFASILLSS